MNDNKKPTMQSVDTDELQAIDGGGVFDPDFSDYWPTGTVSDICGTGLPGGLGPIWQPSFPADRMPW